MFMAETVNDSKLRQEIILTLDVVSRELFDSNLDVLFWQHTFVDHTKSTLTKLMLLIEIVGGLLQILERELPRHSGQALKGT
jgi:hypothetical protein